MNVHGMVNAAARLCLGHFLEKLLFVDTIVAGKTLHRPLKLIPERVVRPWPKPGRRTRRSAAASFESPPHHRRQFLHVSVRDHVTTCGIQRTANRTRSPLRQTQ